jgi:hypothetical protein
MLKKNVMLSHVTISLRLTVYIECDNCFFWAAPTKLVTLRAAAAESLDGARSLVGGVSKVEDSPRRGYSFRNAR